MRALLSPRQVVDALLERAKFESLAKPEAACCAELKRAKFRSLAVPLACCCWKETCKTDEQVVDGLLRASKIWEPCQARQVAAALLERGKFASLAKPGAKFESLAKPARLLTPS